MLVTSKSCLFVFLIILIEIEIDMSKQKSSSFKLVNILNQRMVGQKTNLNFTKGLLIAWSSDGKLGTTSKIPLDNIHEVKLTAKKGTTTILQRCFGFTSNNQ